MALSQEAEERMRQWLRTATHVSRPRRGYSLAEFGLDPNLLRERFAFYTNAFGIEVGNLGGE